MDRALETPERAATLCQCFNIRFKIGDTAVFNLNKLQGTSVDRVIMDRARVVDGIPSVQVEVDGEPVMLPIDQVIAKVEYREAACMPSPTESYPRAPARTAIPKQTAMDIALAHREIEHAEELLIKVKEALATSGRGADLRDVFGRLQSGLQLGVPHGENGHKLFNVPWALAKPIIETHIATQRALLYALSEQARVEMAVS